MSIWAWPGWKEIHSCNSRRDGSLWTAMSCQETDDAASSAKSRSFDPTRRSMSNPARTSCVTWWRPEPEGTSAPRKSSRKCTPGFRATKSYSLLRRSCNSDSFSFRRVKGKNESKTLCPKPGLTRRYLRRIGYIGIKRVSPLRPLCVIPGWRLRWLRNAFQFLSFARVFAEWRKFSCTAGLVVASFWKEISAQHHEPATEMST